MSETTPPAVLVLDELATLLRVSTKTIKLRLKAGTWPIRRLPGIDRKIRFSRVDVDAYLAGRKAKG